MKKYLIGIIIVMLIIPIKVGAAGSATISVSSNRNNIVVGNNITITVTISSQTSFGAWQYDLNYDKGKLRLTSNNNPLSVVGYTSKTTGQKSASYTYTFTAIGSGTANISVKNTSVADFENVTNMAVTNGSTNITIITQAELEASYSKNNYLSSLSVENNQLQPSFNKNTLEYTLELENGTTSINVSANKEDTKAVISGTGTINVSEGNNKIEIKVEAENGNVRTYLINANVKELSPVNVKINNKPYTVIRKTGIIAAPEAYKETKTLVENIEVLSYYSEITDYTLIGLKDEEGNMGYFIYDKHKNTFTPYKEIKFSRIVLNILDFESNIIIPKTYIKTNITIGSSKLTVYKSDLTSDYSLIYGMNVETGKKNLYLYDEVEETLQRFSNKEVEELNNKLDKYLMIITILICALSVTLIVVVITFIKKSNKKKASFEL